jgi:cytosine/adenosine deaminase-related metal-dependent hydrolase
VAEAVREVGLRGVLGQGVIDFPAPGVPDPSRNIEAEFEAIRAAHGLPVVAYLDRLGLLDARTLLVHAAWGGDRGGGSASPPLSGRQENSGGPPGPWQGTVEIRPRGPAG